MFRLMIIHRLSLIGAFLLVAHGVSAGLLSYQNEAIGRSSPDSHPGQEPRDFGRPLYRVFTRRDKGIVNRILSGVQDARGLMIFGSINCVLEYDGQQWTSIPVPDGGWLSVAKDRSGTIWVGGTGEIGALVFDGVAYQYRSYTHLLPESERHLGEVINVATHGDDVYFLFDRALLHWDGQHFSLISLPYESGNEWFFSSFSERLFVNAKHKPLFEVVGNRLIPVLDDPLLSETTVIGAIRLAKNRILLVTREKGIFELRDSLSSELEHKDENSGGLAKPDRIIPFPTAADNLFTRESGVAAAMSINENLFVVGVQRRGLVFLDGSGHIQQTFLEEDGLPTGMLSDLLVDRAGGLWVIGDTSLTRINPNRSITVFDHENGLPKTYVSGTVRFDGALYAETADGLYRLEPCSDGAGPSQFSKVPGITDWIKKALPAPPLGLLLAAEKGLYLFDGNRFQLLSKAPMSHAIVRSHKNVDRFFFGGGDGLRAIHFAAGQWIDEGLLRGFDHPVISIAETDNGNLFVGTLDGIFLIKLGSNLEEPLEGAHAELLAAAPKASLSGMFHMQPLGNRILLGSNGNIFLFRDVDRSFYPADFVPKQILGREIHCVQAGTSKPDHLWLESVIGESGSVQAQEIGCLDTDGSYHVLPRSISSFVGAVSSFDEEPSPQGLTLWISGEYGVARVDLDRPTQAQPTQAQPDLRLYLREATTAAGDRVRLPQNGGTLELPFEKRDIRFRFATDDYDGPDEVRYQTKLDGLNADWTPFFGEPTWQSGSLSEGRYRLHVIARNSEGADSDEFSLGITILPPWYRTPWMYTVYLGLGALAVFGLVRWRLWQMRLREKALVAMVDDRTRELRQSEERLRQHYEELRQSKKRLQEAKNNAEAANRAKTAFLANMSHEVRTPLNSILGYAQLLLRSGKNVKDPRQKLQSIIDSGTHLLGMMNELLDLARVESGKLAINPEPLELPAFLQSLVAEFEIRARQTGLRFEFVTDRSVPQWIEIDALRLRQIIYNLVGNAFKFTTAGRVSLHVTTSNSAEAASRPEVDSKLRLVVSDTGKGIAESDLPHLFKPFYQAVSPDQCTEGIGLGLYITDKIVNLLGGQISATSVLGQGSEFSVELPLKPATMAPPASTQSKVVGYEGAVRELLVVDDDHSNRDVLKHFLTEVGFSVQEADSGDAALRLMRSHRIDAVISDIRMTNKDGNTFCREVRSDKALAETVMIASSASVYERDRRAAESAGFDGFLPKPVKEQELFGILGRYLQISWVFRKDSSDDGVQAIGRNQVDLGDLVIAGRGLPVEELQRLLTLTGEGDVVALRRALQELAETDLAHARFAEQLAVLVSAYRIDEVETLLQQLICEASQIVAK